ncbi:hypothetical protein BN77_p30120 [Rhizobium mesoamericanum STM3625]|uniref:Transposase n=1 Tax=Rhizobium mesoamericanum STM3625 TaxID=1211777 RepID=K0Q076_9HYPH|nr:hypothetical protein BN77_p30120 [Rhizobium mesoamericanum STM3625]
MPLGAGRPTLEDHVNRYARLGTSVLTNADWYKRAALFSGFLSHYLLRDRYGRPGKGNDKGNVEGLVRYARRNFMVPIPQFPTWDAFNA